MRQRDRQFDIVFLVNQHVHVLDDVFVFIIYLFNIDFQLKCYRRNGTTMWTLSFSEYFPSEFLVGQTWGWHSEKSITWHTQRVRERRKRPWQKINPLKMAHSLFMIWIQMLLFIWRWSRFRCQSFKSNLIFYHVASSLNFTYNLLGCFFFFFFWIPNKWPNKSL